MFLTTEPPVASASLAVPLLVPGCLSDYPLWQTFISTGPKADGRRARSQALSLTYRDRTGDGASEVAKWMKLKQPEMTCLRGDRLITSWVTESLFPLSSRVLSQQKSYPSLTVCSDGNFKEAWKFGRNAERRIHGTRSSVSGWPCHSETVQWPVLSVGVGVRLCGFRS